MSRRNRNAVAKCHNNNKRTSWASASQQRNETETGCNNTFAGGRRVQNSTVVKEIGRTDLILREKKNERTNENRKYRDLNNDAEMTQRRPVDS